MGKRFDKNGECIIHNRHACGLCSSEDREDYDRAHNGAQRARAAERRRLAGAVLPELVHSMPGADPDLLAGKSIAFAEALLVMLDRYEGT